MVTKRGKTRVIEWGKYDFFFFSFFFTICFLLYSCVLLNVFCKNYSLCVHTRGYYVWLKVYMPCVSQEATCAWLKMFPAIAELSDCECSLSTSQSVDGIPTI